MPEEVRFQDFVCCAAVVASWKIPACRHTPKACAEKLWLHIFPNPHPPPSPRVSFVRLSKQRSGKALAGEACRGLSRALSTSSCKCCCIAVEHLQKPTAALVLNGRSGRSGSTFICWDSSSTVARQTSTRRLLCLRRFQVCSATATSC